MATRCVSLLATLLALLAPGYHAFPSLAGGSCPGGMAAVGGSHLDFGPGSDSGREGDGSDFQVAFVRLLIDGIELSPTDPVQLTAGEDHVVTVISDQVPMRGILFREEAPTGIDTTATLTSNSTLLQPALICEQPIVGITHNDNSDKPEISASIRFDEEVAGVFLDVTVVFLNQNSSSITPFSFFAYDRFTMNFGGMVPPATPAPITPAPVTPAPVTPAPVTPATPAPVAPMTPAPVTPATPAPVASKKKSSPGKKGTKLTKKGKGKKKKCKSSKSPKSPKTPKSSKSKKSKSKKTKESKSSKECEVDSSSPKKSKTKKTKSPKKSGKSGTKSVKTKSPSGTKSKSSKKTKSSKSSKSSSRRLRHVR